MSKSSRKRAITLVEVLTVIAVVGFVVIMIVAAIPKARENARTANCANNLRQIGSGLLNYESLHKYLPGSAEVIKSDPLRPVGGWSFLFKILPNLEYDTIYNSINPAEVQGTTRVVPPNAAIIVPRTDLGTAIGTADPTAGPSLCAIGLARDTSINEFLCPSNPNMLFENPQAPCTPVGLKYAVTNYKAMCSAFYPGFATNIGATQQYTGTVTVPAGAYPGLYQCDGGLYPTNDGIRLADISDGLSHTILCGETMDYTASCWIAGSDVNMVAIPDAAPQISTGAAPVLFHDESGSSFFSLPGFNGQYDARGGTRGVVTFFALEYGWRFVGPVTQTRTGPDGPTAPCKGAGTYPLDPSAIPCQTGNRPVPFTKMKIYGPSSGHRTVINCLMADGSVRGVRKDVDASALFFAVTRNNHDPAADDHL